MWPRNWRWLRASCVVGQDQAVGVGEEVAEDLWRSFDLRSWPCPESCPDLMTAARMVARLAARCR
jgi:hypothetical protein